MSRYALTAFLNLLPPWWGLAETHTHTLKKPFQLPHKLAKTARHCNTSISFCGIAYQCVASIHRESTLGKRFVRYLFTSDSKEIERDLVVRHYGLDVHNFSASQSLAPQVTHASHLAGKWWVVVTEELKGYPVEVLSYLNVKEAVETLNSYNYVHEDLCPQNLLVFQDGSLWVAILTGAGVAGQECYPLDLN